MDHIKIETQIAPKGSCRPSENVSECRPLRGLATAVRGCDRPIELRGSVAGEMTAAERFVGRVRRNDKRRDVQIGLAGYFSTQIPRADQFSVGRVERSDGPP